MTCFVLYKMPIDMIELLKKNEGKMCALLLVAVSCRRTFSS